MKKSITLLLLVLAVILVFSSCSKDKPENESRESENSDELSTETVDNSWQRELYYDAVEKTLSQKYLRYDCSMTHMITYSDHQLYNSKTANVKVIDGNSGDARYAASYDNGQTSFDYYFANGKVYSTESDSLFKASMSEDEFKEYMDNQLYLAVGTGFDDVRATINSDATQTVTLDKIQSISNILTDPLYQMGMTNIKVVSFRGKAEVDTKGYLASQSITVKLSMESPEGPVVLDYWAKVTYSGIGNKFTIQIPEDDNCTETPDINAPIMIEDGYNNLLQYTYDAKYQTVYSYFNNDDGSDYSISLNYKVKTANTDSGFSASDETTINYDVKTGSRTVTRSSSYENGEYNSTVKGAVPKDVTDDTARTMYYYPLVDYRLDMDKIESIAVVDKGTYQEISYNYKDSESLSKCQTVLTTVIGDGDGIAINAENYTITTTGGIIKVDKETRTLISHEIMITATFKDNGKNITAGFEHLLEVSIDLDSSSPTAD